MLFLYADFLAKFQVLYFLNFSVSHRGLRNYYLWLLSSSLFSNFQPIIVDYETITCGRFLYAKNSMTHANDLCKADIALTHKIPWL